ANAEWETFTIAFYGETNAGKSTVIEALRILLKEESKLARQDAFRRYQQQHNLSPEILENSDRLLKDNETRTEALSRALAELRGSYAAREAELEKELSLLSTLIEDQKKHWSAIRRLIALYILSPEQKQQQQLRKRQLALDAEISQATQSLTSQQAECDRERQTILELRARVENQLGELNALADGEIIGTGLSDFTLDATLYPFEAHGQRFALLDIPGIEGKESKVLEQIKRAVEKAHAVFYVTSKATAPQKGDEENPGTLEKIKSHLNAQTEVWTLFNKRVTNAMGLSKPLVDQDEAQSIKDLNEKMREQLGDNYRDTLVVSAMPGFLSVAEHLVPGGSHIKSRDKFLKSFTREQLLEKTGVAELARVLTQQLVTDSKEKITRSNTQKTRIVLDDIAAQVTTLQQDTYAGLASQFSDKKDSAHKQLDLALKSLYQRLIDRADEGISQFRNQAREQVYQAIDGDISTDRFKSELESAISREHGKLEKSLPEALKKELE
ncbi:MAG: dynamin family protein, partial [Acinetobacter sp.]